MALARAPVVITCAGTWHAPQMSYQLQRKRLLRSVLTTMPPSRYRRRADVDRAAIHWLPYPELIGPRVASRLLPRASLPAAELRRAQAFDRICQAMLSRRPPRLLVAFTTFGLATLRSMRRAGVPTVTECASSHVSFRQQVRADEHASLGIAAPHTSPAAVARELEEYEAADFIAVPSTRAAQTFEQQGIARSKLLAIPLGVDLDTFSPAPPGASHRPFRVLSVGNLGIQKGTHHLIDAMRMLRDRDVELVLAGALDPWLEQLLASANDVRWRYAGHLSPHELADLYRSASLFCLPSLHEGMSLAVLEALACGLPVVVSENAGYSTVVQQGRQGFVVPIRSTAGIAEAIARMYDDPDARDAMANEARKLAMDYSWASYGDRLEQAYLPLIGALP